MFCGQAACLFLIQSGFVASYASLVARQRVGPRAYWQCRPGPNLIVSLAVGG